MILCLGTTPVLQRSMVFDRVHADGVNRAAEVRDYASGKSVNVAKVLRALGEDPLAVGFVGGDRGVALTQHLRDLAVRQWFVDTGPPTRQCITVIDRSAGTATELVEEAQPVHPHSWDELDHRLRRWLFEARAAVFSGSLPPGAPQEYYARWLPITRRHGIPLLIDARGEPLRQVLAVAARLASDEDNGSPGGGGLIVKLNRDELAATLGRDLASEADVRAAMEMIRPAGGSTVVTLGVSGALAARAGGVWRVRPPRVNVSSAVGSGDAFAAGLIAGLLRGQDWPDALALAAACGAANATNAISGHVRAEDVEELVSKAVVESLDGG